MKAAARSVTQGSDAATSRCLSMPTLDGDGRVWGFQTKLSTDGVVMMAFSYDSHSAFMTAFFGRGRVVGWCGGAVVRQ